jgi:hypothetical protein
MVTLNKQHLFSTCKVKTCFSSFDFLTLFFEEKPNHEYYMPTDSHNPKTTFCISNSLNQCGVETFQQ